MRLALAILVTTALAGTAQAQDNGTTTVPTTPIERYNLPTGNVQATPVPTPTPAATLTPAPPPSVIPTLPRSQPSAAVPTPRPRVTLTPTPTASATPVRSAATPVPTPTPTPTPAAVPAPEPTTAPTTAPTVVASTAAPPVEPAQSTMPGWLWWVVGAVVLAVLAAFGWRRSTARSAEPIAYAPEAPTPRPPATPVVPAVVPPVVPAAAAVADRQLVLDFRPKRLWTLGPDAHVAFELLVTNDSAIGIDGIRPVIALASAGPDTAADIARFTSRSQTLPSGEPFALRAGETRSIAGELTLPGDAMYVTTAADRELIVPLALVALHWRSGLSIARATEAYVVGTGDPSAPRLGPIWVDRAGLLYDRLDARRFTPTSA